MKLYLITDGFDDETAARVDAALTAVPPHFAAVQLRAKALDGGGLLMAARALKAVCDGRARLLVNDRVDVALAAGADGVHLPARGLTVAQARALGVRAVAASCHDDGEIARARGADFIVFGPVFATPGKSPPLGVDALAAAVAAAAPMPVFALGGVDASNVAAVRAAGAYPAGIRVLDDVARIYSVLSVSV